ncbi:hypothetical protein F2P56_035805 [Juglans regia]|uniref:Uncharacterized protein n=1 Tax=Juglans regia TaxID=51240 RepID=A0A833X6K4_JUGRE|nr:hypothetical protein F2P56_035805 [Juglans regia]
MEEKIGLLLDEIVWLKRSVKGKEVLQNGMGREGDGLGLGLRAGNGKPVMGPGMGSGVGQAVGPKQRWMQRNRARPEISGLGPSQTLAAPISVSPTPTPSQKEPPVAVDHHGVPLGPFRREEGDDAEVTEERIISRAVFPSQSAGFLLENSQSQPQVVDEGVDVTPVKVSAAEDGHLVGFTSLSCGLSLENMQKRPCVVDGGPVVNPMHSEHGFSELGSPMGLAPSSGELDSVCGSELALFSPVSTGEEGVILTPLCTLPPSSTYGSCSSNWVFKKVEEIQDVIGISFGGYEEQFKALLIAIEASHSKSATKRDRELKRLTCSINYDVKEGSGGRDRSKGRGNIVSYEA